MRRITLITAALGLLFSGSLFAQDWIEYASQEDFFTVNFPAQPKVQSINYETEYGVSLPGHVHVWEDGKNRYSVTVIDYTDIAKKHAERAKICRETESYPDACGERGDAELRGALVYASFKLIQKDVKVTDYAYYNADRVEGHRLQLTNSDGSRTFAAIHLHENRLYILEGTVPRGMPPPALFQQSLGFIDKAGKRIRYSTVYSHGYPAPSRDR
jgi:hypothetical protein